jgi:TP901 family phage tail tape measure protein|nr:MAG TPA: minor tail protein [Caudoviricetes sp.]
MEQLEKIVKMEQLVNELIIMFDLKDDNNTRNDITDIIKGVVLTSNTNPELMYDSFIQCGRTAKETGHSIEEIANMLEKLANNYGIKGSCAGDLLKSQMLKCNL